jgi:hypothetical protein
MRISAWRLALTGGVLTVLAVAGIGLATGANAPATPRANTLAAGETAAPGTSAGPNASTKPDRKNAGAGLGKLRDGLGGGRLLRLGRHLVHAEVTVTGKDGKLVVIQLDHGTVQSVGGGSLTIAETGGATETVSTDDATIVYVGRKDGKLGDVKVGVELFVQSRIDGGKTLAKRILVVPAAAS